MCKYVFKNGEKCKEDAFENSEYCILHMPFPDDKNSGEFERIAKLKEEKVKEKISKGDFNFEGAILLNVDFSGIEIKGDANLRNVVILEYAQFNGAKIGRDAQFFGAKIGGSARFDGAEIGRDIQFLGAKIGRGALFNETEIGRGALFDGAKIKRDALFFGAKIGGDASFDGAEIRRGAWFDGAKIGGSARFDGAKIGGDAWFNEAEIRRGARFKRAEIGRSAWFLKAKIGESAWFDGAKIEGSARFDGAKIEGSARFDTLDIKGRLSLKKTIFRKPQAEENAYRAARRSYEKLGDSETADDYFLHEMRTRRKQKNKFTQFFEWLLADFTCQYGTDFISPIAIWFTLVLVVFPIIYYFGHGIVSSNVFFPFFKNAVKSFLSAEYFSVVTATTLGYGDLQPALTTIWHIPIFRVLASIEAIFGTFMWVIFLTVFARKYMR